MSLRYSSDHEWVRMEEGKIRVGITDYAQDALGDVVFVQVPEVGAKRSAGDTFGEVESTKSVSEIYAPVAGTVVEVNLDLESSPELVNSDPYGNGWIAPHRTVTTRGSVDGLLDAAAYRQLTEAERGPVEAEGVACPVCSVSTRPRPTSARRAVPRSAPRTARERRPRGCSRMSASTSPVRARSAS